MPRPPGPCGGGASSLPCRQYLSGPLLLVLEAVMVVVVLLMEAVVMVVVLLLEAVVVKVVLLLMEAVVVVLLLVLGHRMARKARIRMLLMHRRALHITSRVRHRLATPHGPRTRAPHGPRHTRAPHSPLGPEGQGRGRRHVPGGWGRGAWTGGGAGAWGGDALSGPPSPPAAAPTSAQCDPRSLRLGWLGLPHMRDSDCHGCETGWNG